MIQVSPISAARSTARSLLAATHTGGGGGRRGPGGGRGAGSPGEGGTEGGGTPAPPLREPEGLILPPAVAQADAEDKTPAGQNIQRRHFLGHRDRVQEREQVDRDPEAHRPSLRGQPGGGHRVRGHSRSRAGGGQD